MLVIDLSVRLCVCSVQIYSLEKQEGIFILHLVFSIAVYLAEYYEGGATVRVDIFFKERKPFNQLFTFC